MSKVVMIGEHKKSGHFVQIIKNSEKGTYWWRLLTPDINTVISRGEQIYVETCKLEARTSAASKLGQDLRTGWKWTWVAGPRKRSLGLGRENDNG